MSHETKEEVQEEKCDVQEQTPERHIKKKETSLPKEISYIFHILLQKVLQENEEGPSKATIEELEIQEELAQTKE